LSLNPALTLHVSLHILLQGQVKELDDLAHTFMAAAAADRKALLAQAQSAADAVDTSANPDAAGYVEYYIKTMQRVMDKGDAYIQQVCLTWSASAAGVFVVLAMYIIASWCLMGAGSACSGGTVVQIPGTC
jgi:hypothetical protein